MSLHKTLLAGFALTALAAGAARADDAQQTVPVNGTVARICVLGPPSPAAVDLGQLINTSGARVGKIAAIANRTVDLPNSFCNFAGSHLTVTATALLAADASPVQPGFARAVNYTSTVNNWAATPATVTTAASTGGATPTAGPSNGGSQPTPKIANLQLVLSNFTAPSDFLLVAGGYAGSVTITLGPDAQLPAQ
jgi:hypothetical protein